MKPLLLTLCLCAITACSTIGKSGRCGTYRREVEYRENFENPGRGYECPRGLFGDSRDVVRPAPKPKDEGAEFLAGILGLISPANKSSRSDYDRTQRSFRGDWWP